MRRAPRTPKVTVVTVTHNGARYLAETIASVRAQTFEDFEYIVVDNASDDDSAAVVVDAAAEDARIRLVRGRTNVGPAEGLNIALREARGELFANLDHDDCAHPDRLLLQCAAFDVDASLGVCGGWEERIDEAGRASGLREYATQHDIIHWRLTTRCEIRHSAATMRTNTLRRIGGYSAHNWAACDFDLFLRLRPHTRFANIAAPLVRYRLHPSQTSKVIFGKQFFTVLLLLLAHRSKHVASELNLDHLHAFLFGRNGELLDGEPQLYTAAHAARTVLEEYCEVFSPSEDVQRLARSDCAEWIGMIALRHRRVHYAAARNLARIADDLDVRWRRSAALRERLREIEKNNLVAVHATADARGVTKLKDISRITASPRRPAGGGAMP